MLTTKIERSVFKSMQLYWTYCLVCLSLLDMLLILALFPVNLHTPSSISSKVAYTSFIFHCQHRTSYINFSLVKYIQYSSVFRLFFLLLQAAKQPWICNVCNFTPVWLPCEAQKNYIFLPYTIHNYNTSLQCRWSVHEWVNEF